MDTPILIIGNGLLAELTSRAIRAYFPVEVHQALHEIPFTRRYRLAVVVSDTWDEPLFASADQLMQSQGLAWLPGYCSGNEGIAGPYIHPALPGCLHCAEHRRQVATVPAGDELEELMQQLLSGSSTKQPAEEAVTHQTLTSKPQDRIAKRHLANLLAAAVNQLHQIEDAASTSVSTPVTSIFIKHRHLMIMNQQTLATAQHRFLPNPLCLHCSRLPEDSEELATAVLAGFSHDQVPGLRKRTLAELHSLLIMQYFDARYGLLNDIEHHPTTLFADVTANLPAFLANNAVTGGRAFSYLESQSIAILEGLERYCSTMPRGKKTSVFASYTSIKDQSLHPLKVGVYSDAQYALPDFSYKPYHPDQPLHWVWGYSLTQQRTLLIPEQVVYYDARQASHHDIDSVLEDDEESIDETSELNRSYASLYMQYVQESSNGCAVGGSLEEAVYYGLLEVIERDAFLITWYARLPVPQLQPNENDNHELLLMIDRMQTMTGFQIRLHNMTMEHGVPSILAIGINKPGAFPAFACAAGAHLDPYRAARSALHELAGTITMLCEQQETEREELADMLTDSSLVTQMLDHVMLYSLPESIDRLHFLMDDKHEIISFSDAFPQACSDAISPAAQYQSSTSKSSTSSSESWSALISTFRSLNLDILVVDQTSPEAASCGLTVVKVVVPGMMPMTFGHTMNRVTNLDRVLNVPMQLGYFNRPLKLDELNPYPHPFP